jgi:hypothetical protein
MKNSFKIEFVNNTNIVEIYETNKNTELKFKRINSINDRVSLIFATGEVDKLQYTLAVGDLEKNPIKMTLEFPNTGQQ